MVLIATLATVGGVSSVCNVLDISQLRAADISYVEVDRRGISRAWPIRHRYTGKHQWDRAPARGSLQVVYDPDCPWTDCSTGVYCHEILGDKIASVGALLRWPRWRLSTLG